MQHFTHVYLHAQTAVDAGDIRMWRTTVILITGKTRRPPIWTPCRHQDDAGSGISRVYLWVIIKQLLMTSCRGCCDPGMVLKFGFGRDVPSWNLKVDPYNYQFFKKKWPIHIPICSILGQILNQSTQVFPNFGSNLRKFWKINLFIYHTLHFIRGHSHGSFIYQEADFATHAGDTSPRVFCTDEYPPWACTAKLHSTLRLDVTSLHILCLTGL